LRVSYPKFKEELGPFLCFSLHDAKKHFPGFDRKRLTEWQQKGYVQKIVRGHYVFNDVKKDFAFWWLVANCIYSPSYVSLQSALYYYDFIPEAVFQVTSITTKRTRKLEALQKRFLYRNCKPACYFGYTLIPFSQGHHIRVAEPEKAILDLLYLEPSIGNQEDFEAWRFNRQVIEETINCSLMEQYAKLMNNQLFYDRFMEFKKWLHA
jgi:predicted transcriptional regulator of viral defense system